MKRLLVVALAVVVAALVLSGCSGSPIMDAAISNGDATGYLANLAFDANDTTTWISSQTGTAVIGNAYIGRSYETARTIDSITITQNDPDAMVTECQVLYSDNGWHWTPLLRIGKLPASTQTTSLMGFGELTGPHHYWIVQAYASASSLAAGWKVNELAFN